MTEWRPLLRHESPDPARQGLTNRCKKFIILHMLQPNPSTKNLATYILEQNGESVDDYLGWCSSICDAVLTTYGGQKYMLTV
jgi:hypothetical protein